MTNALNPEECVVNARNDTDTGFRSINRAYDRVFRAGRLSIGLVVPLETYDRGPVPDMHRHLARAKLAESLGFSALWLRDVPFLVPAFGDAGQLFDPWVYLGLLAGQTRHIALGVASVVLPLRHPAHVAKAAATVDVLSDGRLLLGVASGDRPDEYPAMALSHADRGASFRESFDYIERMAESWPAFRSGWGALSGQLDLLPKPTAGRLPLLVTGGSQQQPDWIAAHGDGWMLYPRPHALQSRTIAGYRARLQAAGGPDKPVMQPLYVDLLDDPDAPAAAIHLGLRTGVRSLVRHLHALQSLGINHVALNLRFNRADTETTLEALAANLLPHFPA